MRISLRNASLFFSLCAGVAGCAAQSPPPLAPAPSVQPLLQTEKTVLGQTIIYPRDTQAEVTAVIITLPPGAETGLHRHDAPFFAYIMEGELTVEYEGYGARIYKAGDALMEANMTPHNGRNSGDNMVRILAVFMGGEGVSNTTPLESPEPRR